jgi:hypothetical protein
MVKYSPIQAFSLKAKHLFSTALLVSGIAIASSSVADDIRLADYSAVYETTLSGFTIEGHRSLQRGEDGIYKLSMQASAMLMSLSEESHFSINGNTLLPLRYQYLFKKPLGSNRQQTIRFNWASMTIDGTYKKPWTLPLSVGVSDRLNVLAALRIHLLSNGLSDFNANIADRGKFKNYTISPAGEEQLETPIGDIKTVVLTRTSDDKTTSFWLAPDMDYQLIRFLQEESDGDRYELNIKSLELSPAS